MAFSSARRLPGGDLVALGGDLEPSTIDQRLPPQHLPDEGNGVARRPGLVVAGPARHSAARRLRVTRSMRQSAKRYEVRVDTRFEDVMRACADPSRDDGWIDEEFIAAYTRLHHLGWAHSVEVFDRDGQLAGGCTAFESTASSRASRCSIAGGTPRKSR